MKTRALFRQFWLPLLLSVGFSPALPAQELDEDCVVSILNRTARVRPDGSWRIDNVPANFGQVRARFTCSRDGQTFSGQSAFFDITEDIVNGFNADVTLETEPVPEFLRLSAPAEILTAENPSMQLSAVATYADQSAADRTSSAFGTSYTVSNGAVAEISPDGRITARASGTILVTAMHEGALAVLRLQVVLAGDGDGDGISDDLEVANGLNPNDPVDALEDPDGDGLISREEVVDLGTNPRDRDTDDDGINDGEEAVEGDDGFITSGLLRDTDGDGFGDALEIETGSDPTDPTSFALSASLEELVIKPAAVTLAVNPLVGEASQQLQVQALLRDGSTVDLTAASRGTAYSSSDLAVCNFGSEDGQIFAGQPGRCTVTVSNGTFSSEILVEVQDFTPVGLSFLPIPTDGYANNVDVNGNYAYVAAGAAGLHIVDISNRSNPRILSSVDTPGNANDVRVVDQIAYIADGRSGLQIVDVQDPTNAVLVGSLDTPGEAFDVRVVDRIAYIADSFNGLQIIDVANALQPRLLGGVDTPGISRGVDLVGTLAAVADGRTLQMIDVQDPANPQILGALGLDGDTKDVAVRGNWAYVAAFTGGLQIVDFTDPANPTLAGGLPGSEPDGFIPRDVALFGSFATAAEQLFPNAVPFVSLDNPTEPVFRTLLDFSPLGDYAGTGIAVDPPFIYMTGENFFVNTENGDIGNTGLFIGQFRPFDDRAGQAPQVAITAPAANEILVQESVFDVEVEASDDVRVAAVDLLVDGQIRSTDRNAPYQFRLEIPSGATELSLSARAADFGNNVSFTAPIVLPVIPDPLTSIAGRIIGAGGTPVVGLRVGAAGVFSTSADDGTFLLDDVPTVAGTITTTASGQVDGVLAFGSTGRVKPVRGGRTELGDIVVRPTPLLPSQRFLTGSAPSSLHLVDINGDQKLDALTSNAASHDFSVLLGNGDGTFQEQIQTPLGASPQRMDLADLNGDGHLDIVSANQGNFAEEGNNVSVLLGNGDGSFEETARFPAGNRPSWVVLGDFDANGTPDALVVNSFGGDVSVLLGNGDGTLQDELRARIGPTPFRVFVGDMNEDGRDDLVVTYSNTSHFGVVISNGNGTFQDPIDVSTAFLPHWLDIGDINNDGHLDVVSANRSDGGTISSVLGNGDGTFGEPRFFEADENAGFLLLTDLSGDGLLDAVVASEFHHRSMVFVGKGDGSFQEPIPFSKSSTTTSIQAADLNGDGHRDLVWATFHDNQISVLLGNGDGTLNSAARLLTGETPNGLDLGDIDGDGRLDAVAVQFTGQGDDQLLFLRGKGDGTLALDNRFSVGDGPEAVLLGDLDGDGLLDAASASRFDSDMSVLLGNGDGTFQEHNRFDVGGQPNEGAMGDLDGNGGLDLIFALPGPNQLSVSLGNGDGTFEAAALYPAGSDPSWVDVGDLDEDGDLDLVTPNRGSSTIAVLLNNGDGTFGEHQTHQVERVPASVAMGDFDRDGHLDVVATNFANTGKIRDNVSVLLGNGDATFKEQVFYEVGSNPIVVEVGDIDRDGNLEIVSLNRNSGDISVLRPNGNGTFLPELRFDIGANPKKAGLGDLDGNGSLDLVVVSNFDFGISTLRSLVAPASGVGLAKSVAGGHSADQADVLPTEYGLGYNYPNPFNPTTLIPYSLPAAGRVRLAVYNIMGQRIRLLVDGEQRPGFHQVQWDGHDTQGRGVATGVYFYQFVSPGLVKTGRMLLLR
jgi:hypothetical protein